LEKEVGALLSQSEYQRNDQPVFVTGHQMITSLGFTIDEHIDRLRQSETGIRWVEDPKLLPEPCYVSLVDQEKLTDRFAQRIDSGASYTRLEKMALLSIHDALASSGIDPASSPTIFLFATTKGNIDLLGADQKEHFGEKRAYLWETARVIKDHFSNPNRPITVSNACVSGVLAINTAADLLRMGHYRHAVVLGADIISSFTALGFQSFKAIGTTPCRPFDSQRDGLTLGEGAGTIIFTTDEHLAGTNGRKPLVSVAGGGSSNDANHISGPSRTGEELNFAIQKALDEAGLTADDIDHLSAHGTATEYNDEMESKAFTLAGLQDVPTNSLKGYFGHTLGAAGIIESVGLLASMYNREIYATKGYQNLGVPKNINIVDRYRQQSLRNCLKSGSGFGGSNATVVFKAHD
jgi:3-oxoacyl-[acyl-carrier-protein] synthase-1